MLYNTNEVIRRGTGNRSRKWMVRLLKGMFRFVYVVGKIIDLIKWISHFFGE
jgi:hypothetical protein